ncbi:hypothetical protein BRC81_01380 [Halobacteriales archaeon QS_1_68_20]|nr:MAG: hypothetical protein BRC81_01380 [Halobacteriales archaeon QS_1_68_20]
MSASTAAADPEGDSEYPVHAHGKRVHHFRPLDGDHWEHRERFISRDIQKVFGKAEVELKIEEIHADHVPEQFRDPDRAGKLSGQDDGVFGTWEQHANAERDLRQGDLTQSHDYTGPLYNYKDGDLSERASPINVGWRYYHGFDHDDVQDEMTSNGWDGILPSTDRYVLVFTGSSSYNIKEQDAHVRKPTGWTKQYHGRLYDLPDADDDGYDVIGQFHHDPWDHGWLVGDDWKYAESRQEASSDWESWGYYAFTQDVGNGGGYDSSNGKFDAI